MRRVFLFLAVGVAVCLVCWVDAHACGDKFLVVGRGVRYQRVHAAVHRASILLYMNPASHLPAAAKNAQLESSLKKAGHQVQAVADGAGLKSALESAKYDLVLADIADSPGLEKQVSAQTSKPTVVPVLYKPTSDELAAAKKEYGCAMKTADTDYLATIDDIMGQKLTGAKGK